MTDSIFAKFARAVFWIPKLNFCLKFIYRTTLFVTSWNAAPNSRCNKRYSFSSISKNKDISWLNLVFFLKSYGFSIIEKTFFIISSAKLNLILSISIAGFCRLRWWSLKELSIVSIHLVQSLYISLNALPSMWLIRFFNFLEWSIQITCA